MYLSNDNALLETTQLKELISAITKRKNRELALADINTDEIYQELKLNAFYLLKDISENKIYENSHYKKLGQQQCLYKNDADKSVAYWIMTETLKIIIVDKQYHSDLSELPLVEEQHKYQIVIADETQNLSILKIMNLLELAEDNKILLLGDSLQKGKIKVSSLALIKEVLYKEKKIQLEPSTLPSTFRLTPENARVLNQLILLYGNLKQGRADSTAYTSLNAAINIETISDDENPNNFIEYVDNYIDDFKAIGKKATAAAIVLDEKDKAKVKTLIAGKNIFDVYEAQGLDFSEVFFYISEESAQKLIALSSKMQALGINSQTKLKEYLNQSPQKTQLDGDELETLSNLIVGLSRSTGGNWIYIEEKIAPQLKHKITPFLDWLKTTVKANKIQVTTVEQTISSEEDWLLTINKYIEEGATKQAEEYLKDIFNLTEAQIVKYLVLHKNNALVKTLQEFKNLFTLGSEQTTISQKQAKDQVTAKESSKAKSKTAENNAQTQPSPTKNSNSASQDQELNFAPLKPDYKKFVEDLYKNLDRENNIKALLTNKFSLQILFDHKMENGETLFANIMISNKVDIFIKHLTSLLAKKDSCIAKAQINTILNNGYKIAEKNQDYALMLAISQLGELKAARLLNINGITSISNTLDSFREGDKSKLGQVFHHPNNATNEEVYLWLKQSDSIYKNLLEQDLSSQFINEKGDQGFSFMFMRIVYLEDAPTLTQKETNSMKAMLHNTITLNHIGLEGMTGLMFLFRTEEGIRYLEKSWRWIKSEIQQKNLLNKVTTEGYYEGKNAFYFFCEQLIGQKLLLHDWKYFEKFIPSSEFCSLISRENGTQDVSPIFHLCTTKYGVKLLDRKWSYFKALLLNHPNVLSSKVTIEQSGFKREITPLYQLCQLDEGITLIFDKWEFFKEIIPPSAFCEAIKNDSLGQAVTPFFILCSTAHGIKLLASKWLYFKDMLSNNPNSLLAKSTIKSLKEINIQITPLYQLCTCDDGIKLLSENWDFFEKIITGEVFFTKINNQSESIVFDTTTSFTRLCGNTLAVNLIDKHWSFFKGFITNNNFIGCDGEESPYSVLCSSYYGREFIEKNWDDFCEIISLEDIEQNPCYGSDKLLSMIKNKMNPVQEQRGISQFRGTLFDSLTKAIKDPSQTEIAKQTPTQRNFRVH